MYPYHQLFSNAQHVGANLWFHPMPGAEPLDIPLAENPRYSFPGNSVYVDKENACVITRTCCGVYVSLQGSTEAMDSQLSILERIAHLHS